MNGVNSNGILPPEVSRKILSYGSVSEIVHLSQVSKNWKNILREIFGSIVYLGTNNDYFAGFEYLQPEAITNQRIVICNVSNVPAFPSTGYYEPSDVREIRFVGSIPRLTFHSFLQPLNNLCRLVLHTSTIAQYNLIDAELKYSHFISSLESLEINSLNFTEKCCQNKFGKTTYNLVRNLQNLLHIKFVRLKSLLIEIPNIVDQEVRLQLDILNSIAIHQDTLKSVLVEFTWSWKYEPRRMYRIQNHKLEVFVQDELMTVPSFDFNFSRNLRNLNLEAITLNFESIQNNHSTTITTISHWFHLFYKSQGTKMRRSCFYSNLKFPFLPAVLLQPQESLESLVLSHIRTSDGPFIDCQVFQNCSKLRNLYLCGDGEEMTTTTSHRSRVIHTELLPISLKNVVFCGMRISSMELASIVRRQRLESLTLLDAGENNDFGLSIPSFLEGLKGKVFLQIKLSRSLNIQILCEESSTRTRQDEIDINSGIALLKSLLKYYNIVTAFWSESRNRYEFSYGVDVL